MATLLNLLVRFPFLCGLRSVFIALSLIVCFTYANDIAYNKFSLSLYTDNDAYFSPRDFDRYYSAGHSLYFTSVEYDNSFINDISIIQRAMKIPTISRFYIGIGQEIYTPSEKFTYIPPKDDALYAGFLYLNGGIQNRSSNFMEQISLNIGIVGPASLAREAQDLIHSITNNGYYNGWNTQIRNEIIFNLYYKSMYRFPINEYFDILPYGIAALGNAHTYIEIGAKFRAGYGLDGDFGLQTAQVDSIGSVSHSDNMRAYFQFGFSERFVLRNIFLQGNTIGGVQSDLDLNRAIYGIELGAVFAWRGYALSYLYSYKRREFVTQLANHSYATIRLEVSF